MVELDVADVLAGKRSGRFHWRGRSSSTKADLASAQVCTLAACVGEIDIAPDTFTFHKRCLTGSNAGGTDGCAVQRHKHADCSTSRSDEHGNNSLRYGRQYRTDS